MGVLLNSYDSIVPFRVILVTLLAFDHSDGAAFEHASGRTASRSLAGADLLARRSTNLLSLDRLGSEVMVLERKGHIDQRDHHRHFH